MAKSARTTTSGGKAEGTLRFSTINWILLLAGLVAIVAGYVLLNGGSTVVAPLLLVAGYLVLIPLGIIR